MLNGSIDKHLFPLSSGEWKSKVSVLVELSSVRAPCWLTHCCLLTVPHGLSLVHAVEQVRDFSLPLPITALIPIRGTILKTPSKPNYQRPHFQISSHWQLVLQQMNFGKIQTFTLNIPSMIVPKMLYNISFFNFIKRMTFLILYELCWLISPLIQYFINKKLKDTTKD